VSEENTEFRVDPASLPALVDYYRNRANSLELEFINYQVVASQEIGRLQAELAELREPTVAEPAKSSNKRTTG